MPYTMGVLEGFQERRDKEFERNVANDRFQRQQEGEIYKLLLSSRDPQMHALAMTGLLESARPGQKAKGLRGFMGEVQNSQHYAKVLDLMNSFVPQEPEQGPEPPAPGGGPMGPAPGSAAMSQTSPVHPGSAPIQVQANPQGEVAMPPAGGMAGGGGGGSPTAGSGLPAGPTNIGGAPGPSGPPPLPATSLTPLAFQSQFKRRGTGIPTAEEVAEWTELSRRRAIDQSLLETAAKIGLSPGDTQAFVMGAHGSPQRSQMGGRIGPMVTFEGAAGPQATILRNGVLYMEDGETPVPQPYQVVPTPKAPGGGSAGLKRDVIEDPNSPTGRTAVYNTATPGMRVPGIAFTPPPATTGAGTILDANGVPVTASRDRDGNIIPGPDAPSFAPSQEAQIAKSLREAVDAEIKLLQKSKVGGAFGISAARRNQIVQEKAKAQGLGYQTYDQLLQAEGKPKVPAREATQGSSVDGVLKILQQQEMGAPAGGPPPTPGMPQLPGGPRR